MKNKSKIKMKNIFLKSSQTTKLYIYIMMELKKTK